MPKVQLQRDFRGRATRENFYRAGAVVEVPDRETARQLMNDGFAILAADDTPVSTPAEYAADQLEPPVPKPAPVVAVEAPAMPRPEGPGHLSFMEAQIEAANRSHAQAAAREQFYDQWPGLMAQLADLAARVAALEAKGGDA